MGDFLVKRDDLRECKIIEAPVLEAGAGEVLLAVDRFGLTANNITYAVFGEAMSYWNFFPAEPPWGHVPMWGFAQVLDSRIEGIEQGARLYGYLPPASQLLVTPGGNSDAGFLDAAPHRAALPAAYQRYVWSSADPLYSADTEELQMLLRPLFFTSFLIDDQLVDDGLTERGPIVIASASSKTAIGVAFLLAQRDGVRTIGLTSASNVEFVSGLGIYTHVVAYEEIPSLELEPATLVDMAGNSDVRLAVHSHYREQLAHSMAVGVTHWEDFGGGSGLPGPQPVFFFAPDRIVKRSSDWGGDGLEERIAAAWHPFCEWAGGWLEVRQGDGFEAVRETYLEVLEGRVAPSIAHVLNIA